MTNPQPSLDAGGVEGVSKRRARRLRGKYNAARLYAFRRYEDHRGVVARQFLADRLAALQDAPPK